MASVLKSSLCHTYGLSPYNKVSPTIFDKGKTLSWRRGERERDEISIILGNFEWI